MITTTDPIYFNEFNLLTIPGWFTTATDPNRYADRDVTNIHLSNTDLNVTTSGFYTGKKINISAVLILSGRELLDQSISQIKRVLRPKNKTLQLPISGEQRKFFEVTVSNIAYKNMAGGYCEIDIEFTCSDPFNYALVETTVLDVLNNTSGNRSYPVTFDGTAEQAPYITYTVDSFTNGSNKTVTFSNPITGVSISIQRDWTALDILVIDSWNMDVTVNGTAQDFTGNFITWDYGPGFLNYTDNFTARQVDILLKHTKRYE